jgi:RNA:NAD 2'-phosphotransferase (TPT1/KptA family)
MVKKKKIEATTDNSGWVEPKRKKVRKARKPMTEEQKQAAVARLEKARAKRAENNPDYGKSSFHESLLRKLKDGSRPKKNLLLQNVELTSKV